MQSILHPASDAAQTISDLSWWVFGIGLVIWLLFICLEIYVLKTKPHKKNIKQSKILIIGGGTLFPVVIITLSIYFSLIPLPKLIKPAPKGSLTVKISGLQWWWRVKYVSQDKVVETANEIWLPVNEPVQFVLKSEDVIHSFWIPSLGGKMDMIPGRKTLLSYTPKKTGHFEGACAEYCGTSHALMRLDVRVVEKDVFNSWLENQKRPAYVQSPGREAFLAHGCTSCHTVRGLSESGTIGPDLTHVGGRMKLGASTLKNDFESLHKFIHKPDSIKPGIKMPAFDFIPEKDKRAIAHWLKELK